MVYWHHDPEAQALLWSISLRTPKTRSHYDYDHLADSFGHGKIEYVLWADGRVDRLNAIRDAAGEAALAKGATPANEEFNTWCADYEVDDLITAIVNGDYAWPAMRAAA